METEEKEEPAIITRALEHINNDLQGRAAEKELDLGSDEAEASLPISVTSRVLFLFGDITAGSAYHFTQWLESVRKRSGRYRSSGFPNRPARFVTMPLSVEEPLPELKSPLPSEQASETNLWERLGNAAMLDIESSDFSWNMLSSLHHTEHNSSTEHSEDELNRPLEVTVNSGGVVFFALFNRHGNSNSFPKEAAAVIKISSSRMATQSERLGYEFAKWLGVRTPQARVIHNSSLEWQQIKDAAEKARDAAISVGDEVGEVTCSELLEALELSRCLFLMNYIHGSPLLESSNAFDSWGAAERTAAALGRVLMLDLVIRNEDRLPCRQLGWRGNSANLLFADKMASANMDALEESFDSAIPLYRPRVIRTLQKERRANSADSRLCPRNTELISQSSDASDLVDTPKAKNTMKNKTSNEAKLGDLHIVTIDSGVPRRPPAGKRVNDQENYPKLIELLLNSSEYAFGLLHDITGGKVGSPLPEEANALIDSCSTDNSTVVHEFRSGFRAALRDLQGFHLFLLTLHQKLENLLRAFLAISYSGDFDREDLAVSESPLQAAGVINYFSPLSKERVIAENHPDSSDLELQSTTARSSNSGNRESSESFSPISREGWSGKFHKGGGEPLRSLRLTAKLRDFNKFAKVDAELSKELEQWNEMLRTDAIKLCQENNFNSGFFEGGDNNSVVDAYELKVRLEHILERIALICDAANTEKPSSITGCLFIGGALAARSVYTLQHLGITHILCLCSNEIGQSDSQYLDLFEYKNFSICDDEDTNIGDIFEEASDFIDHVEQSGGRVLVHCFEGRSRSATVVIAYLMLKKNFTLSEAWNALKRVHRRASPNDGFARILMDLDRKLHGKVSMEWQKRKPVMKVCPVCGKNAGLSSSSLKLHLQKSHRKFSSGSVDSAMTMEIQKALSALKMSRGGSVSPTKKQSQSIVDILDQ